MKNPARRNLILGVAITLVSAILLVTFGLHARAMTSGSNTGQVDWSAARAVNQVNPALEVPQPNQEPCLSCHIFGEDKSLWTPLGRWLVFGTFGLLMVFGIYRSTSVWKNRAPWKSLQARAADWLESRYAYRKPLSDVLNKPVHTWAQRWFYCLGGITAFLFVVQAITGILLALYYKPTAAEAYSSIQFIETQVRFGSAIRMIHHWAANGMIVMCIAHMLRVFIMGAYRKPRELNWISGAFLLLLTLVFGFTGYLLPWDQRAFWATTVGTDIAGAVPAVGNLALVFLRVGWDVSDATLGRFYGLHIIITPLLTITFMLAHFIMIRRLGVQKPL